MEKIREVETHDAKLRADPARQRRAEREHPSGEDDLRDQRSGCQSGKRSALRLSVTLVTSLPSVAIV